MFKLIPLEAIQPYILTLRMDAESQAFFDKQRELYFPRERNFLKAHISLFHQLPNDTFTKQQLKDVKQAPVALKITGMQNLGAGVAYKIESDALQDLHRQLSACFKDELIPQDRQRYRPHITIQNKVTLEQAKALIEKLNADFEPFEITGIGLDLWTYRGGPWEFDVFYPFKG
ncbi:2'-5' RNA ligase family protein [Mucilaginibacter sp. KACC 22063]|uniref:2'-5' RNA ligase family protein n=1 Tax=Mucilaginibacter sp. KACC 22063 TaxID=3025666 RepID=UPI0023659240|nr:2'-5' RNA ligase family protein [Mucilaginibacter sp. KACC 22063]WDF54265.1 2'-5' RNA ligase family protein [Mucilaginibacter sp. KACC 22063]